MTQNVPNPASDYTLIEYTLPESSIEAYITFADLSGRQVGQYPVEHSGEGTLQLELSQLAAGTYIYSLSVDGKVVDSKKMVVK